MPTANRSSSSVQPLAVRLLRGVVSALAAVSAVAILALVGVVCVDVVLRLPIINKPFIGGYDLVRLLGAVALAAALPYTTAVKGHVAIEFFFHKLTRRGRLIVDSIMRILSIALFGFWGWRCVIYGQALYAAKQVSQTLGVPLFWLPMFLGLCCFVCAAVVVFHLLCPGKEMMKL